MTTASAENRSEYSKRMHRVLEYVDSHLDQTLELADLAEVAHFSAFHFHRLFAAWMGETLGEYLRRRRLEVAATRLLAQPAVPVLNIALSVGFGSTEAFARAFKTRFGCTATEWREREAKRRDSNPDQLGSNPGQAQKLLQDDDETSHPKAEVIMKVKIIERQPTRVAYMRHIGPYGAPIADFWKNTVYPWMFSNNLIGLARYGVSHDDPDITAPEKCRYDACVEVPPDFNPGSNVFMTSLPGGRYAATRFVGTAHEVVAVWSALLRDWLPASGFQLDARPFIEYYPTDGKFDPQTGAFECDLLVPVIPL